MMKIVYPVGCEVQRGLMWQYACVQVLAACSLKIPYHNLLEFLLPLLCIHHEGKANENNIVHQFHLHQN